MVIKFSSLIASEESIIFKWNFECRNPYISVSVAKRSISNLSLNR